MDSYAKLVDLVEKNGLIKKSDCKKRFKNDYNKIISIECSTNTWAERVWLYVYGSHSCYCGNETKWLGFKKGGHQKYCSKKCATSDPELIKRQNKSRKKTSIERYGVEYPTQLESTKKKAEKTNLKRYGVKSPTQNKDILEKSKQTLLKNYGVENPSKNPNILEKRIKSFKNSNFKITYKNTSIKKYGVEHPWSNKKIHQKSIKNTDQEKRVEKIIKTKMRDYIESNSHILKEENDYFLCRCEKGHEYKVLKKFFKKRIKNKIATTCTVCQPFGSMPFSFNGGSDIENEIYDFINEQSILKNNRSFIYPYEIDILVPNKLAIEVNGMYWHSDLHKEKFYHQFKSKKIHEMKIPFLTIWEDQWNYKKDILKSMINNFLGNSKKIGARKCTIKKVSPKDSKKFLDENHLQGHINSKIKIGLYYNDELVSLMTLGGLRKNLGQSSKKNEYELLRFCNKLNTTVIGGASKLLKYFEKNYNPNKIISYAAYERSNGNLYEKLGFKLEKLTFPGYFYYKNGERFNRFKFRKSELIKEGHDPNKSGFEIMDELKYLRCYDSGNLKFIKSY